MQGFNRVKVVKNTVGGAWTKIPHPIQHSENVTCKVSWLMSYFYFEQIQMLEGVLKVLFKEMRDWFCKNLQKLVFIKLVTEVCGSDIHKTHHIFGDALNSQNFSGFSRNCS